MLFTSLGWSVLRKNSDAFGLECMDLGLQPQSLYLRPCGRLTTPRVIFLFIPQNP